MNVTPRIVEPLRSDFLPCTSPVVRMRASSNAVISTSLSAGSTPM